MGVTTAHVFVANNKLVKKKKKKKKTRKKESEITMESNNNDNERILTPPPSPAIMLMMPTSTSTPTQTQTQTTQTTQTPQTPQSSPFINDIPKTMQALDIDQPQEIQARPPQSSPSLSQLPSQQVLTQAQQQQFDRLSKSTKCDKYCRHVIAFLVSLFFLSILLQGLCNVVNTVPGLIFSKLYHHSSQQPQHLQQLYFENDIIANDNQLLDFLDHRRRPPPPEARFYSKDNKN
jgi:hypothetical protein